MSTLIPPLPWEAFSRYESAVLDADGRVITQQGRVLGIQDAYGDVIFEQPKDEFVVNNPEDFLTYIAEMSEKLETHEKAIEVLHHSLAAILDASDDPIVRGYVQDALGKLSEASE